MTKPVVFDLCRFAVCACFMATGLLFPPLGFCQDSPGIEDPENEAPAYICRFGEEGDGFVSCPTPVWHGNSFDGYSLNTGRGFISLAETYISAFRLDPGTWGPIHAFDRCYFITNAAEDEAYFVPFRAAKEWEAFIQNHPATISLTACSFHGVYVSSVETTKGDHATFSLLAYAQEGEVRSFTQSFGYLERAHCENEEDDSTCKGPWDWIETISVSFRVTPTGQWEILEERVEGGPPAEFI